MHQVFTLETELCLAWRHGRTSRDQTFGEWVAKRCEHDATFFTEVNLSDFEFIFNLGREHVSLFDALQELRTRPA